MRSSYLRMTRSQTVMTKRWRNQSSHDLKKQFELFQSQKVTQESNECQELLGRTRQGLASGDSKHISNLYFWVFLRGCVTLKFHFGKKGHVTGDQ